MDTNIELNQILDTYPTFPVWGELYSKISPHSNTGEKSQESAIAQLQSAYKDYPLLETITVMTNDGPKPVQLRRPAHREIVTIDFLNITLHKETFLKGVDHLTEHEEDYCISAVDHVLQDLLGLGIEKKLSRGINCYEVGYALQDDCGHVCIGGQRDTILISLNGQGCTLAQYGWEENLYKWLDKKAQRPKITRIDYAYDDLDGSLISVDWADQQDSIGGFTGKGRPPSVQHVGNWKRPDGSGRTIYIGKRKNSNKYCRFYEKGKQLGDKDSLWTRCEVEFHSRDIHIPLSALINASEHFLASYPCFHVFDDQSKAVKFEYLAKKAEIVWDKAIEITKHQFSKYLKAFRDFYEDDSKVLDMLMPAKNEYPKRLKPLYADYTKSLPPTALPA